MNAPKRCCGRSNDTAHAGPASHEVRMTTFAVGFSVVAAAILLVAYLFFLDTLQKTLLGKFACAALLVTLALLQVEHQRFIDSGVALLDTRFYASLLLFARLGLAWNIGLPRDARERPDLLDLQRGRGAVSPRGDVRSCRRHSDRSSGMTSQPVTGR